MTLAGAHKGASGDLSPGLGTSGDPGRHRWLRWLLLALGVLMVATLVILAALAGSYQPLTYGESENSAMAFPGLPTGQGIHPVNNMGGFSEDFYLPPQRGTFSLFASLGNYGTYPITIESVSLPGDSLVKLVAPPRYSVPGMGGSDQIPPPTSRVLHDVVLRPGQEMYLGFLVRTWPCAVTHGWETVPSFSVTERFLFFGHTVAIPWGMYGDHLVMHFPGGHPGQPNTICAGH